MLYQLSYATTPLGYIDMSLTTAIMAGARGSLVGIAACLHQTAVYQWVGGGGDLALRGRVPHWAMYLGLVSSYPGLVVYVCIIFQKMHRFPPLLNLPVVERP